MFWRKKSQKVFGREAGDWIPFVKVQILEKTSKVFVYPAILILGYCSGTSGVLRTDLSILWGSSSYWSKEMASEDLLDSSELGQF